jgi:uncharacterized protein (TIGR02145 family)
MVLNILKILSITSLRLFSRYAWCLLILVQTFSCYSLELDNPNDPANKNAGESSSSSLLSSSSVRSSSSSGTAPSSSSVSQLSSSSKVPIPLCDPYNTETHYCSNGTVKEYGYVSDVNKTYKTVVIGEQTWMAENLNYNASGSWCYGNDHSNCDTYGRLYDWATAMNLSSSCNSSTCASQVQAKHRGICPEGWHIPSNDDWSTLNNNVGGSSTAGEHLKSTSGWKNNGNGLDTYGFSALPGGRRYPDGHFGSVGDDVNWWSASEHDSSDAYSRYMNCNIGYATWGNDGKAIGFSVRCLQDNAP